MGNCLRLEQWLLPLQTEPVLLVAAAPVDGGDEVVDEEEDEDEVAEEADDDEVMDVLVFLGVFHRMSYVAIFPKFCVGLST